jgi:hypothetical protein
MSSVHHTADRRPPLMGHIGENTTILWCAFVLVHLILDLLAFAAPDCLWDVKGVYRGWVEQTVYAGHRVGIDEPWVYPILAILPMLMPLVFGSAHYTIKWLCLVMVLDAVALAILTGPVRNQRPHRAAWWWLGFLILLGPIAVARIDSISVPLAIVGLLYAATRPRVATMILTIGAWIKVWPAALVAALTIASGRRLLVATTAAVTSGVILAIALFLGSGTNVFSFVTQQVGRGLQIESPVSTIWMWRAFAGKPGTYVYFDQRLLTYQVTGDGVSIAGSISTVLMFLAVLAIVLLAVLAVRNRVIMMRLLPPLTLALVTVLIAFNKVGSPQYIAWCAAPVILGLVYLRDSFRTPAVLVLVLAALTQLVFPYFYRDLVALNVVMLMILTARNLLLFVILGWTIVSLWKLGRPAARDPSGLADSPSPVS